MFDATGRRADLERTIGEAIEADVGFEVTTFVRTAAELRKVLAVQPFDVAAGDTYFVTFLLAPPTAAQAKQLEALSNDFDTLEVHGREVHWLMHGKSSDSNLTKPKLGEDPRTEQQHEPQHDDAAQARRQARPLRSSAEAPRAAAPRRYL